MLHVQKMSDSPSACEFGAKPAQPPHRTVSLCGGPESRRSEPLVALCWPNIPSSCLRRRTATRSRHPSRIRPAALRGGRAARRGSGGSRAAARHPAAARPRFAAGSTRRAAAAEFEATRVGRCRAVAEIDVGGVLGRCRAACARPPLRGHQWLRVLRQALGSGPRACHQRACPCTTAARRRQPRP